MLRYHSSSPPAHPSGGARIHVLTGPPSTPCVQTGLGARPRVSSLFAQNHCWGSGCVLPRSPPIQRSDYLDTKAYGWKLGAPQLQRQTSGTVSYMRAVVQQCMPVRSNGLAQKSQSLCRAVAALTEHLAAADERITCV